MGWEGFYEVSNLGRVRSLPRQTSVGVRGGAVLRPIERAGYHRVRLRATAGGRSGLRPVHTLVLEAFVGPRPPGAHACHRNDIPHDNRLQNLRWGSPRENYQDKVLNGRLISEDVAREAYRLHEEGMTWRDIGGLLGWSASGLRGAVLRWARGKRGRT